MGYLNSLTLLAALCILQNLPATVLSKFSIKSVSPKGSLPPPRADHSSVVVETQDGYFFLVHGGRNEKGALSDTWTYGVNSNSWDELTPLDSKLSNDPPPPMYGAISGYRYVEGYEAPFLYVTLGTGDGTTKYYNDMWVMEFKFFTWKKVALDGDIPSARYGVAGGLELFAKYDDTFQSEFIVSHGIGADGPVTDSFRCKLDPVDPYRATWERIRKPISQYSIFDPHPRHLQGSAFTPEQNLLLFGGCQSTESTGGYCPSSDTWKLEMSHDGRDFADEHGDDGYRYNWVQLPNSPPARVGSAMAKGLSTFEGLDDSSTGTSVVLFSGVNRANDAYHRSMFRQVQIDHSEISIYSTQSNKWERKQVVYQGSIDEQDSVLAGRQGPTLSIVKDTTNPTGDDVPNEFYLLFGGQAEDGAFHDSILKVSYDPFSLSEDVSTPVNAWSIPQLHGTLMYICFGLLTPLAAFVLRYLREKRKKKVIGSTHLAMKGVVLVLAWISLFIVRYSRNGKASKFSHAYIGYVILVLATVQMFYAIVIVSFMQYMTRKRRATQYDQNNGSSRSKTVGLVLKWLYRVTGIAVLSLGLVNITLGLFMLSSPLLLWVHWIVFMIVISIIAFWMELTLSKAPFDDFDSTNSNSYQTPGVAFLTTNTSSADFESTTTTNSRRARPSRFSSVKQIFATSSSSEKKNERISEASVPYFH